MTRIVIEIMEENKMKKKLMSCMLAIGMAASVTGCSTEEIGFYNLLREYNLVAVDQDMVVEGSANVLYESHRGSENNETYTGDVRFNIVVDRSEYLIKIELEILENGVSRMVTDAIISPDVGVLVKVNALGLINQMGGASDFVAEIDSVGDKYVRLYDSFPKEQLEEIMLQLEYREGQTYVDLLTSYLSGFESNLFSSTDNGYVFEITSADIEPLLTSLVSYCSENVLELIDLLVDTNNVAISSGSDVAQGELELAITMLKAEPDALVESLNEELKNSLAFYKMLDISEDTFLRVELMSEGDGLSVAVNALLGIDSSHIPDYYTLDCDVDFRMTDGVVVDVPVESDVIALNPQLETMHSAIITWRSSSDEAFMSIGGNGGVDADAYSLGDELQLEFVNGNTYIPVRKVGQALGENVQWDEANRTAGVEKDGEFIPITGFIKDGSTFVKVRDFEKLGYTVGYSYNDSLDAHQVFIY